MGFSETIYCRAPAWSQTLLLNAYAWRIERHRYGQPYRQAVGQLLAQERWPPERLRDYQDARLREIVAVAYGRSPYYRRAFDAAGIRPYQICGVADLPRIPLLTKETVREHRAELLTRERPGQGWLAGHTSGTTGSPLEVWYDQATCILNNAVDRRQKVWGGMSDDAWIGLLLGRVIVPPRQAAPPFWRTNWIQRQVWFSSFHMRDRWLGSYVVEMRRRGLRFLEGYPSTLYILATYLRQRGITLPMQAVFTSSETLHTVQRETIEAAFECRVFDFYGLAERVIFAGECERHAGKHAAEEFGIVEVVDEDGLPVRPGQAGYLVGTSLHNTAMPLLRYRTSDVSALTLEQCECGRTSRRVRDVTTKAEDIVVTPDGRMVSPSVLTHPFKPLDQILKSQIVQDRPDHIVVKLVPSGAFEATHERQLVAALRERLGPHMAVEVRIVDDISREPSGKYRWVVSQVAHSCRFPWEEEA